jgi:hypothetical protein
VITAITVMVVVPIVMMTAATRDEYGEAAAQADQRQHGKNGDEYSFHDVSNTQGLWPE